MADEKILTKHVGISVELQDVAGRRLVWDRALDGWCQEDAIGIDSVCTSDELRAGRRTLALDAAVKIYAEFGWDNPPREELATVQQQRFGAP